MKYGIRVRDIMAKRLVKIGPDEKIVAAANLMKKNKVGAVAVVENEDFIGVLTDGDIIRKMVSIGATPTRVKVKDIMSPRPITVSPDDDLYKISNLMNSKKIKRVFVMEGNKLIGYLSERDLLRIQPGLLEVLTEKLKILQPSFKLGYRRGKNG